jgi:hypothetical protein
LLGVLAGDISTTVVTATAFGCALALPYARQAGFSLAAAGAVAFGAAEIQGFAVGDGLAKNFPYVRAAHGTPNVFAVLSWLIDHPAFVAARISEHAGAILSNLAPSGVVGLVCPFTALPTALVLFENVMTTGVHGVAPGAPELAPAYYLLLPGLAWALVGIARLRLPALVAPASALVVANCAGWFCIWFPLLGSQAILVSPPAATALEDLHDRIGDRDEVVASDHFAGSFADREFAYGFRGGQRYAIRTRTYVALSARDGAGPDGWAQTYGAIATLLSRPDAHLTSVSQGLWIFEFPRATRAFESPATAASIPAGVLDGDVGRRDLKRGTLESDGRAGYLVRDAIWRDPPGRYAARITANGPLTVEAWDANRNTLLTREQVDHAGVAVVPFDLPYRNSTLPIAGAPVFRHGRNAARDGNDWIEVRVAVAKDAHTRVEQVGLDGDQGLVPNF